MITSILTVNSLVRRLLILSFFFLFLITISPLTAFANLADCRVQLQLVDTYWDTPIESTVLRSGMTVQATIGGKERNNRFIFLGRSIDYYGKGKNAIALYGSKMTFFPEDSVSIEPGLDTYDGAGDFVGIRPQEGETCLANSVLNCLRTYKYFYPESNVGQILTDENESQVFKDLQQRLHADKPILSMLYQWIKIKLTGFWGRPQYLELVRFFKEHGIKYRVSTKKHDLIDHLNAGGVAIVGFPTSFSGLSISRHGGGNITYIANGGVLERSELPYNNTIPKFISGTKLDNSKYYDDYHAVLVVPYL